MKALSPAVRRGWSVAARAAAAILGGYGLIWLLAAAMSLLLTRVGGMSPLDSVLAVTMSSFLVWALIAIAVFHAASARRAWTGLFLGGLACMAVLVALTGRPLP